nr:adenylate cyclase type 10-like [Megalopta genalis]
MGTFQDASVMFELEEKRTAWTPDLIGPIFKKPTIGLREVLLTHRMDKCVRTLATFVPDELIYETDISRKNFRKFNVVLAMIDVSRLFGHYQKYTNADNGGSYALVEMLNSFIGRIVEEVYYSGGDVYKFSLDGIVVLWRVSKDTFFSSTLYNVILHAQKMQAMVEAVKDKSFEGKIDVVVSAGEVIFSVIGDDTARDYVIGGSPVMELKFAKRICLPGDLVLCSSAWEHCAPSQYEYVIKDSSNVKIIRVLGEPRSASIMKSKQTQSKSDATNRPGKLASSILSEEMDVENSDFNDVDAFSSYSGRSRLTTIISSRLPAARISIIETLKQRLGVQLETYIHKPVLEQIKREASLDHLTEVRRVTVLVVNVIPNRCTVHELISLIDEIFSIILKIATKYSGHVSVNIYTRDILLHVVYGMRGYGELDDDKMAKSGVLSALQILDETKRVGGIKTVFIGISTGMAFCGVIGHCVRQQYMIIGDPMYKATSLMALSFGKAYCDYDTVMHSYLKTERFQSRGMMVLKGYGKTQVYEVVELHKMSEEYHLNIDYVYPILGRTKELEYFKDILDDIGVPGKSYAGMLIEGAERSGKSRLLDAFAMIAQNRQLTLLKLALRESFVDKEFSVLYQLLLQLFCATNCTAMGDRERIVSNRVATLISPKNLCYLNPVMKVHFPLTKEYCKLTDWERHTKTIDIFNTMLQKIGENICILLDDVQNMDVLSWKFLSAAMENDNVIVAMTMLEPISWDNLSQAEMGICQDKRLLSKSLQDFDSEYITAFACQFLNVLAIPKFLDRTLQKRGKNAIAWCEAFLTSSLQTNAVEFTNIAPNDPRVHELVFPKSVYVTKVPSNLTPEELAPPLNWTQMSRIRVCLTSWRQTSFIEINRDVMGLRIDIYNRMNPYEQDFIKCAATLGGVFVRNMIANVMVNAAPLYTSKAVAEMIRLRILECAMIQRRNCHIDESMFFLQKNRRSFSNMQHLTTCECQPTRVFAPRSLPTYAHCQYLEFVMPSYRKLFYNILPVHERKEFHTKAIAILERYAHRCSTCGGDGFLSMFSKEEPPSEPQVDEQASTPSLYAMKRRRTQSRLMDRRESKRNVLMLTNGTNDGDRKNRDSVVIRRISLLPSFEDNNEEEDISAANSLQAGPSDGSKKTQIVWENRLKHLSHLDYRNCRCVDAIDYSYWRLLFHLQHSQDLEKLTNFMLDYSAGLIATGQPIFATKFLSDTTAEIKYTKAREQLNVVLVDEAISKEITLLLIGDAYVSYGNYGLARRHYKEALNMRSVTRHRDKSACYGVWKEKLRFKLRGSPNYLLHRVSDRTAMKKLELAICLQRLSLAMMLEQDTKSAKSIIIQSFDIAFRTVGGFLEKGIIFLTAVKIFRKDYRYVRSLEKSMMQVVSEKTNWQTLVELIILAKVYRVFFENSFLNGELKKCMETGINLLKICSLFHYNEAKIAVLPTLIEVMVWTKNLNAAMDLLKELYFLSEEDVDRSALTWYYALCLEVLLDAGMFIESYDTCYNHYLSIAIRKKFAGVVRDPQSLTRLSTCVIIWQLRMSMPITDEYLLNVNEYVKDMQYYNHSQIYSCIKGLECYLLILNQRINIKRSHDVVDRLQNATTLMRAIRRMQHKAAFVKPFMNLFQGYMFHVRGRKSAALACLQRANKWAVIQGNRMIQASVQQNKRTWQQNYNNMAMYWVEALARKGEISWQEIHNFDVDTWSTVMYPLPIPTFAI